MKVLVTGVRGFVGARIMEELKEMAQWLKDALSLPVELQEAAPRHNLWINCAKARQQGIFFQNTVDGLRQCIADYSLRRSSANKNISMPGNVIIVPNKVIFLLFLIREGL